MHSCLVEILDKRTVTLVITTLDTVKNVKEKIQNEVGICADQLTLLLKEEQLEDENLMTYYGDSTDSLLQVKLGKLLIELHNKICTHITRLKNCNGLFTNYKIS